MKTYDAILLTLRANDELLGIDRLDERPIGRAATQGLVYLEAQKIPNKIDFGARYYGPFSYGVLEGLARLCAFGYVREDAPNADGFACEYRMTRDGRSLADDLSRENGYYGKIKDTVQVAANHCELRQNALACAAKTHFLRKQIKGNPRTSQIAARGRKLGWAMDAKDVNDGMALLRALKLA